MANSPGKKSGERGRRGLYRTSGGGALFTSIMSTNDGRHCCVPSVTFSSFLQASF